MNKTYLSQLQHIFSRTTHFLKKAWVSTALALGSILLAVLIGWFGFAVFKPQESSGVSTTTKVIKTGSSDQTIAVLNVTGVIVDTTTNQSIFSAETGVVSSEEMIKKLAEIETNDQIKAVILKINSPGGTVVASDQLYKKVAEVATIKPVIASFGDVAASGGYYIAMGATKVMAHPSSITGSIGVIFQTINASELLTNVGVKMVAIKSGELKDIGSPGRPMTEQERAVLQSVVDDAYAEFVSVVQHGTSLSEAEVKKAADGRIYSGKQALALGLVDQLGGFDDAITLAAAEAGLSDPQVVSYGNKSFIESLLGVVSQRTSLFSTAEGLLPHAGLLYLAEF